MKIILFAILIFGTLLIMDEPSVYAARCFRSGGGGETLVSTTPTCTWIIARVPGGRACVVQACSSRWESTNEWCVQINPSDNFGYTNCQLTDVAKFFMRRKGDCAPTGDPNLLCFCAASRVIDFGNIPNETVKKANLSGSSCGCARA